MRSIWALLQISSLFLSPISYAREHAQTSPENRAFNETESCPLFPTHGLPPLRDGRLSPLWNFELVGADLARASTNRFPRAEKVKLEVLDGGFNLSEIPRRILSEEIKKEFEKNPHAYLPSVTKKTLLGREVEDSKGEKEFAGHGTDVVNFIAGEPPFGMTDQALITKLWVTPYSPELTKALNSFGDGDDRVIGFSVDTNRMRLDDDIRKKRAAKENVLLFAASGNGFADLRAARNLSALKAIGVVSIGPAGFPSSFSQESDGKNIFMIGAPAGLEVRNPVAERSDGEFGRTSAAQPIVTGAEINLKSILGVSNLNYDQTIQLFSKTATPTANSYFPKQTLGPGMINPPKLVEVAKRLEAAGWKKWTKDQRNAALNNDKYFDFVSAPQAEPDLDAGNLLAEGKKLILSENCGDRQRAVSKIRLAYHLSTGTNTPEAQRIFKDAANFFALAYEMDGYSDNARFLRNLEPEHLHDDILATVAIPTEPYSDMKASRTKAKKAAALGAGPELESGDNTSLEDRASAVRSSLALGAGAIPILNEILKKGGEEDHEVKVAAARVAAELAKNGKLPDVTPLLLAFADWHITPVALYGIANLPLAQRRPLVEKLFRESPEGTLTRDQVAKLFSSDLGEKGLRMAFEYLKDGYVEHAADALVGYEPLALSNPKIYRELFIPALERAANGAIQTRRRALYAVPRSDKELVVNSKGEPFYRGFLEDKDHSLRDSAISYFSWENRSEVLLACAQAGIAHPSQENATDTARAIKKLRELYPDQFTKLGPSAESFLHR